MIGGTCGHCGSHNQHYLDRDYSAKHHALRCFVCGHIAEYRRPNGERYTPPPYQRDGHHMRKLTQNDQASPLR